MSTILISVIIGLIVNEGCDVSPWCARRLVRWSAHRRYAEPGRAAGRAEELEALIDARPGQLLKLFTAVGFAGSALLVACRRTLARSQQLADEGLPQDLTALTAVQALPGQVDIAGPLNLVAAPNLSARLASWQQQDPGGQRPDFQDLIENVMSDLRLLSAGPGVPAILDPTPHPRGASLFLYTTSYVLRAVETRFGDAYTVAAIRPISAKDRERLAAGTLRLRPATWSYYPELITLPGGGDSRWSLIRAKWATLHPDARPRATPRNGTETCGNDSRR